MGRAVKQLANGFGTRFGILICLFVAWAPFLAREQPGFGPRNVLATQEALGQALGQTTEPATEPAGGRSTPRDGVSDETANRVDFNRDIQPILSANCFPCHGFDEGTRAADLRLDTAAGAYESAIVPGEPTDSLLLHRVRLPDDASERMPPVESNLSLTPEQIDLLDRWIQQGAEYQTHWSLIRPVKPEPPIIVAEDAAEVNPIDAFVRKALQERGLPPSPPADRYTLIRRVSLDLLGLPPTAEEIEAFVNDISPDAYERLVERLLANPHFGERMALDWLDAARYADTNGYSIDGGRHQWLWRDWVIQAFNDNKPYDQFLLEQLAGDRLPERTIDQWVATGFQRNNMVTHEGGTIPEENLANYNADRVKTLGEAILGLTLACAQCHNHKYDPLSQREYYQMVAFFNSLPDRGLDGDQGINPAPSISARTMIRTDELPQLEHEIAALEARLATLDRKVLLEWEREQAAILEQRGRDLQLYPAKVLNVTTPNMGSGYAAEGENGVRLQGAGGLAAFDVSLQLPALESPLRGVRIVFQPLPGDPQGSWGGGKRLPPVVEGAVDKGTFVLTALSATADRVPGDQINLHQLLDFSRFTASSWRPEFPPRNVFDPRNPSGWSPDLATEGPVHFTATFVEGVDAAEMPYMTVQVNFGYGQSMIPGLFQFYVLTGEDDGTELPADVLELLQRPVAERTEAEWLKLWQYCSAEGQSLRSTRIDLANLVDRRQALTAEFPVMVMSVAETPRATHVLHRGDYLQPGEQVSTGTPAVLPPLPDAEQADRLSLARWLIAPDHPLTSRVAVNRFWQLLFGRGLVATPADFGAQGQWPSHPELLDWLAVDFQEHGWDVKRLLFQIVTSQTYRQSSATSAAALAADPLNEWLGRGPRFRLSAELVRDLALKSSGLLVPRLGGPSVNPYTPGDPWREVSHYGSTPATAQIFVQDHGEKLYRRSLYTYWKRTAPPTNLSAFDAPNREVCVVGRPATTTPLQALVLWNDVQFVEATRVMAQRILHRSGSSEERLRWAMLEIVGRPPTAAELDQLLRVVRREHQRYSADREQALQYLQQGESPRDESLDPAEQAAWAMVAGLLFNLSETITKH